jgi:hypothetical protein
MDITGDEAPVCFLRARRRWEITHQVPEIVNVDASGSGPAKCRPDGFLLGMKSVEWVRKFENVLAWVKLLTNNSSRLCSCGVNFLTAFAYLKLTPLTWRTHELDQ